MSQDSIANISLRKSIPTSVSTSHAPLKQTVDAFLRNDLEEKEMKNLHDVDTNSEKELAKVYRMLRLAFPPA
nr:hypothetical protein [Candidatus Njordarchaeum guaymaensis]